MIFGLHVGSHIKTGYIEIKKGTAAASTDRLILKVLGKNGHGAYPHEGVDAIVIASYLVTALQSIISRNIDPTDSALIFSFIRWRVSSFKVLSVPVNLTSSHIILPLCPPSIFPKEITAESVGSIFRLMML